MMSRERPVGESPPLHACLGEAAPLDRNRDAMIAVIQALSGAAIELAQIIAAGPFADITGKTSGVNPDGDSQRDIDVVADRLMREALRTAPVASVLSEEAELPEELDPDAPLCIAIDPLDGSANLENNISVGTIFSIRPRGRDIISTFFEPGSVQRAAGFFIYGPQTVLVLALDERVDFFILDQEKRDFFLVRRGVRIPPDT